MIRFLKLLEIPIFGPIKWGWNGMTNKLRKNCRTEISNKHNHMTTNVEALFEQISNLQKLSLFYTANRKHVSKKDCIWLAIFQEMQALILDIWYRILELLWLNWFRQKLKEGVWREKRMSWFDFRTSYNTYIRVWIQKGKIKNKSKMQNVWMVKDKTYI